MKVILVEDVEGLGRGGEILDVKDGYGRNFLLPRKLALKATKSNLKIVEQKKRIYETQRIKEKQEAEELARKIAELSLTIVKKVGESDTLYGSVTTGEIVDALKNEGFEIDKRKIEMEEPIKTLGMFIVKVKLYPEVVADLKVWVVKE
jgi:large subunit ribosomal protein L9